MRARVGFGCGALAGGGALLGGARTCGVRCVLGFGASPPGAQGVSDHEGLACGVSFGGGIDPLCGISKPSAGWTARVRSDPDEGSQAAHAQAQ